MEAVVLAFMFLKKASGKPERNDLFFLPVLLSVMSFNYSINLQDVDNIIKSEKFRGLVKQPLPLP